MDACSNPHSSATPSDIGWCVTAKEPDVAFSYHWTIEDFKIKMESFKLGQQLESSQFSINGFKLCVNLYPNGRNEEEGGHVSLFLRNDNSVQLEVMCEFILGRENSYKHSFSFNKINPNSGYGFPKMYSHDQIISKDILENDTLEIKAIVTFKGKVKNICHTLEQKVLVSDATKVGHDLYLSFEKQEFCDFSILCGDKDIKCHKVVLASRSPMFRAMLLNEMEESSTQKVEMKNFDFEVMYMMIKFLYKGAIETHLLEKHVECIFKAADYFQVIDLKKICEQILIRQITLRNMLDLYILADTYKAQELKTIAKDLIVANSKEILKRRDWKSKLDSKDLLFEILEAVIVKSET